MPFAATLAAPEHRGRVVGTLMVACCWASCWRAPWPACFQPDWRLVYAIAAATLVLTALALQRGLPRFHHSALGYFALLRSIGVLFVQEPVLRQRTLLGHVRDLLDATGVPAGTAAVCLQRRHHRPVRAGRPAAGGRPAGRMSDRGQTGRATAIALALLLLSWLPLGLSAHSLLALLVGVVVLDLAAQLLHVSNQNLIYALQPAARNRLNAGYMTGYFIGGSLGSLLSAQVYQRFGWTGVCVAGAAVAVLALCCAARCVRARPRWPTRNCPAAPAPSSTGIAREQALGRTVGVMHGGTQLPCRGQRGNGTELPMQVVRALRGGQPVLAHRRFQADAFVQRHAHPAGRRYRDGHRPTHRWNGRPATRRCFQLTVVLSSVQSSAPVPGYM